MAATLSGAYREVPGAAWRGTQRDLATPLLWCSAAYWAAAVVAKVARWID